MKTFYERLMEQRKIQASVQEHINEAAPESRRALLLIHARNMHEEYPHYEGHWDNWQVGRMPQRVVTKSGVAFEKGDWVLYDPNTPQMLDGRNRTIVAYSVRNNVDTSTGLYRLETN